MAAADRMSDHDESALLIVVPEAEALVGAYRERYDPVVSRGVPAHVTLHYPFKEPHLVGESDLASLGKFFADRAGFDFELATIERFPGVLYLAPRNAEPFVALMSALARRYPEWPPYGGRFSGFIPHLTVAQVESAEAFEAVANQFRAAAGGKLPIRCRATEAWLYVSGGGMWRPAASFAFG